MFNILQNVQIVLTLLLINYLVPVQAEVLVPSSTQTSMVIINLQEYPHPLRNPHKGFTNRGVWENNEWATLMHSYIKWNEIERDSLDGIERIKSWCDTNWAGVEDKNVKVIPRVYLHWDGDQTFWPTDMETFDYTSPQFIRRLKKMIRKLGECWDTDPRVAHIEMGIIGKWGEQHSPSPTKDVEQILGEEFSKAFTRKKVMVRHPWEFNSFKFGIYWDSWAHQDQMNSHGQSIYNLGDRWKTEFIGGEVAYNWGNWQIQPGEDPTDTMVDSVHRDFLISTIRWLHCTQLRWVADYNKNDSTASAGAEEVHKVIGYRYVIDQVTYPGRLEKDRKFTVSFTGRNTGSAPFYYNWPVELSLLDEYNNVVWSADFDSVDIRTWMPGDQWVKSESIYSVPVESFQVRGTFKLESNISSGRYKLALAVLDPAGRLPGLRFAIKNYLKGGRHPIGYIGVETDIQSPELDSDSFDDPYMDKTLKYIYHPDMVGVSNNKAEIFQSLRTQLLQNYPNPFNPETTIQYHLSGSSHVKVMICNLLGQRVANLVEEQQPPGLYSVKWYGKDDKGAEMASGIYFYRIDANEFVQVKKFTLLR